MSTLFGNNFKGAENSKMKCTFLGNFKYNLNTISSNHFVRVYEYITINSASKDEIKVYKNLATWAKIIE